MQPGQMIDGVRLELNLLQHTFLEAQAMDVPHCTCRHCARRTKARLQPYEFGNPNIVHHVIERAEGTLMGSRYATHNAIRDVLCEAVALTRYKTERFGLAGLLQTPSHPNIPDVIEHGWKDDGKLLAIDVTLPHPCRWIDSDSSSEPPQTVGDIQSSKFRAIFEEGFLARHEAEKKSENYAEPARANGIHMVYAALETTGTMSADLLQFLREAAKRAVECGNAYSGGGCSDAVGKRLEQQNFHKFLRWVACARIRLYTDRMHGAAWEAKRIKDTAEHASVRPGGDSSRSTRRNRTIRSGRPGTRNWLVPVTVAYRRYP